MTIVGLLVFLIVIGIVFWAVRAISAAFKVPEPITTVVYVLLVLVAVLYILRGFGLLQDLNLGLN